MQKQKLQIRLQTKAATQTADKYTAGLIRKLRSLLQVQESDGHLDQIKLRLQKIHIASKNERDNYMKELEEKMKQHKEIEAQVVSLLENIIQVKGQEIPVDGTFSRGDDDDVRLKRIGTSNISENKPNYLTYIYPGDHHATYNPTEDKCLNTGQVVVTNTKAIETKDEKMKERNQINSLPHGMKEKFINKTKSKHLENLNDKKEPNFQTPDIQLIGKLLVVTFVLYLVILLTCTFKGLKRKMNRGSEEKEDILVHELENVIEEVREATRLIVQMLSMLTNEWINFLPDEMRSKFINRSKSIHPEDSLGNFKLLADIITSSDKTGGEPKEYIHQAEVDPDGQDEYLNKSPAHMHKNASAGERSKQESTPVKLYRNVMQNETCRMMTGIDMVVSEANRLFGNERTQIFFDLLDDELFNFGLSGAAPGFIPNMTQSTVRQHVISFFEHSCDTMNRLMTLLLGCPDRKLQQMPEQNFISLMQSVIGFSLKTTIKGGKRPTSKGSTFVMVDSEEFEKALGNEIPDNVLNRLSRGDEMVVHRFDTRLERTRDPQTRENRPILSIFFPSDRKIFIYIPTENGSYWHQADMQRASRICRNNK